MPLFTRLGLPDDCTFSFVSNPDPKIYTEVEDPAPAPAAEPEPEPEEADEATDEKDDA